jgi:hypothetical protein
MGKDASGLRWHSACARFVPNELFGVLELFDLRPAANVL